MERVNGTPLDEYLQTKRLTSSMFAKIERAVIAMWKAGIAHADLNPGNIMILPNGGVTIIDFGISETLPKNLRPKTNANAMNQAFQARLMNWIEQRRAGYGRAAMDPHSLRWMYAQVTNKNRVPRARAQIRR